MAAFSTFSLGVISTICGLFGQEPGMEMIDTSPAALESSLVANAPASDSSPRIGGVSIVEVTSIDDMRRRLDGVMLSIAGSESVRSALDAVVRFETPTHLYRIVRLPAGRAAGRMTLALPSMPAPAEAPVRFRRVVLTGIPVPAPLPSPATDPALMEIALRNLHRRLGRDRENVVTGSRSIAPIRIFNNRNCDLRLPGLPISTE